MSAPATSPYLHTADIAQRLGVQVDTVYRLVADEGLPAHRIARRLKFIAADVDAWVRSRDSGLNGIPTGTAEVTVPPPACDAYAEYIARVVEAAPPLTSDQVARLTTLLSSAAKAV
ncbi:helix-turn-helix domain-containing protein [Nocardia asiatica]|uniref:helix-turn-helix domain-containing protein n=1 Tax=Nocardia asiatica TaxID=209252 RepID=UPI002453CE34|nr:helix-turn-helix domain-containing protein [Nocardia asiatica]